MSSCWPPPLRTCGEWPSGYVDRHQDQRLESHRKRDRKASIQETADKVVNQEELLNPGRSFTNPVEESHPSRLVFQQNRPMLLKNSPGKGLLVGSLEEVTG
jgi:hypothetical protein